MTMGEKVGPAILRDESSVDLGEDTSTRVLSACQPWRSDQVQ